MIIHLNNLVEIVKNQLGLEFAVEARLHKLVLYEEGGGFDWHQDTEKSKGMFGSLVIHLPSYHEGGELFIEHEGTLIKSIHNQQEGEDGFYYSAFYSDCYHKVNPITKGHRFTLLFDLIMKDFSSKSTSTTTVTIKNANKKAKSIVNNFVHSVVTSFKNDDIKPRFMFRLAHKYSDANRCLFKGRDRDILSLLQSMKDENGNDLFFITLGTAKRKRSGDEVEEEEEDGEEDWETEGKIEKITYLPNSLFSEPYNFNVQLTEEEGKILFSSPYRENSNGFQGNEPSFIEHWYKESFGMLWLADHHFSIVSKYYDITDDFCKLIQNHPVYGKKYFNTFIEMGTKNLENTIAASSLLLKDKKSFLITIACEHLKILKNFIKSFLMLLIVTWLLGMKLFLK